MYDGDDLGDYAELVERARSYAPNGQLYVLVRDGAIRMTVPNADARDGYVGAPDGTGHRMYCLDGQALQRDGKLTSCTAAVKADPSCALRDYEPYLCRPGVPTSTGLIAITRDEYDAPKRATQQAAQEGIWGRDRKPTSRSNQRAQACDRCGCPVPPGYGDLAFCGADTGCPEHMDTDGWHVTCADPDRCAERKVEGQQRRREERMKNGRVHISSCGWGDYASVIWEGDLSQPGDTILAQCRAELVAAVQAGRDVDRPHQTDEELFASIRKAREQAEDR